VPSPSSIGRGVYSADDATRNSVPSSSSSWLETGDGCGRRKKYARDHEWKNLRDDAGQESITTDCRVLTNDKLRGNRIPRFRSSHQRSVPTSPAAPVPDAKYLDQSKAFRPSIALVLLEEHVPDFASRNDR